MSFAKMKFLIAIILLTACAAVQGRSVQVHPNISMRDYGMGLDSRIIDGHDAGLGLLPWQAALLISVPAGTMLCGGSLISEKWILTAAHCFIGAWKVEVHLGSVNLYYGMEYNEISYKFLSHENFELPSAINDIALVELPVPATLSVNVQIIPLAARSHPDLTGSTVRVSGHGRTIEGVTSETLKYVDLTAITNTECAKFFEYIFPSTLCAQAQDVPHHNACKGDSGGPLVHYNLSAVQVGVVSFGYPPSCLYGTPSAYARVTSFLDWINQHTGIPIRD